MIFGGVRSYHLTQVFSGFINFILQCQDESPVTTFYFKIVVHPFSLSHGGNEGWITYLRSSGFGLLSPGGRSFFCKKVLARVKPLSYYYDIRTMGTSKKESFNASQNRLADLAKALAHPARIAIIQFLAKKNACICGDIVEELPLSQATVSQHLAELKRVGLIKGDIEGPRVCYCIDPKVWKDAKQLLGQFLTDVKSCC
jgi:ArsR family transcriptional regulator, arsenate/arsenite/antimonite-responsive transcriptional repressor